MTKIDKAAALVSIGLLLAIVINITGILRAYGSEPTNLVPVQYARPVHRVPTVHYLVKAKPWGEGSSVEYTEFSNYTGLNDYPKPVEPLKVLVKEIDPDLIITGSVVCVFVMVVGFVAGYGARKTN